MFFQAIAAHDVAGMLGELDTDGDGHLSLEEHLAAYRPEDGPGETKREQ